MEENEIIEETIAEEPIKERKHPLTVISVFGTEQYPTLHNIQQNSAWGENPYGEAYAVVPDDMVEEVMTCGCWCNIEVENGVLTKITKVDAPYIPPEPHEPTDIELLQEQVTELQMALCEQYEENLLLQEEVTNTQLALVELYEGSFE